MLGAQKDNLENYDIKVFLEILFQIGNCTSKIIIQLLEAHGRVMIDEGVISLLNSEDQLGHHFYRMF